jgi:hypothetical protein
MAILGGWRWVELCRLRGRERVVVTDRAVLSGTPALVGVNGGRPLPLRAWAGPGRWISWWDAVAGWRGSGLRVVLAEESGEVAFLLLSRDGSWSVVGGYD